MDPASTTKSSKNLTAKSAKSTSKQQSSHDDEQLNMLSDKENNNTRHDGDGGGDELDRAATKIQSTFRGYKTRKNLKKTKSNENLKSSPATESRDSNSKSVRVVKKRSNTSSNSPNSEENIMADKSKRQALINDPQVAAIKIQSTFRGYKTRKQLESRTNKLPKNSSPHDTEEEASKGSSAVSTSETSAAAPFVRLSEEKWWVQLCAPGVWFDANEFEFGERYWLRLRFG